MKPRFFVFATVVCTLWLVTGCGHGALDQTDPKNVVQRIFDAAKADDPSMLAGLCNSDGDGDTKRICELSSVSSSSEEFQGFKEAFQDGTLDGEANIAGDEAEVPFHFGPGGRRTESMVLVREGGKWYLNSF